MNLTMKADTLQRVLALSVCMTGKLQEKSHIVATSGALYHLATDSQYVVVTSDDVSHQRVLYGSSDRKAH